MARKKPPSFDFFADDFIAGTYHLPAEAVGIYIRLLCYQWSNGSIPKDEESLCRIAGVDALAMRTHMRTLCQKLCENDAGDYFNERLELERAKKLEIIDKAKKSAELRWNRKNTGDSSNHGKSADADAMRTHMPTHMRTDMPTQCSLLPTSNVQLPNNTHTHTAPGWLEKDWKRWCNYREARDGRPMDAILSETVLMDLMRRGDGKAQRDIEFSILKQARSILDSDNDFSKRTGQASSGTGSRRYGKPTAEEIYKQREAENPPTPEDIEARERILKLQKEMWDESIRR